MFRVVLTSDCHPHALHSRREATRASSALQDPDHRHPLARRVSIGGVDAGAPVDSRRAASSRGRRRRGEIRKARAVAAPDQRRPARARRRNRRAAADVDREPPLETGGNRADRRARDGARPRADRARRAACLPRRRRSPRRRQRRRRTSTFRPIVSASTSPSPRSGTARATTSPRCRPSSARRAPRVAP